jgi:hypothetical protein
LNALTLITSGYTPFGVVEGDGMKVVRRIHNCGEEPKANLIESQGNEYLTSKFPELSYILSAKILPEVTINVVEKCGM